MRLDDKKLQQIISSFRRDISQTAIFGFININIKFYQGIRRFPRLMRYFK
jgi:hypothetical protein